MPGRSVKRKTTNARSMELSSHQAHMLRRAASWEGGMVSIKWFTMRTARVLERRGFGEVRDHFDWAGWGICGWCFIINDRGREAAAAAEVVRA